MKSAFTLLIGLIGFFSAAAYQSEHLTVARIDGLEIGSAEFLYAFQKNRSNTEKPNIDSLRDYLNNYINFKLKVMEAKRQGYDTTQNFKKELQGYLAQIRKPYLENPEAEEKLIAEIHRRMQIEINASHLLIKVDPGAVPQDTLKVYQFMDSLKQTINSREEFESLAKRYSQDGTAANGGNLGWFSAMDMVGPFEEAAYQTSVNRVSEIIKTQFGYHLLFVNSKRPSRGRLKTSHIFFSTQARSSEDAYRLASSVYDSLTNGSEWNTMARKYSDDNRTKMNGGQLQWARIKQLPDDFFDIAYPLEHIGDFSKPEKTRFGWHIVKLDGQEPIGSLTENRAEIEQQIKRSGRNTLNNNQLLNKLKAENNFTQDIDTLSHLLTIIGNGNLSNETLVKPLFNIGGKSFTVNHFVETIPSQKILLNSNIIRSLYSEFERKSIINFEDSIAPFKYPEYGFLMQEYEEGLLLFEIMQKQVWNKAIADSIGSLDFYNSNLRQYKVGKRALVNVLTSQDKNLIQKLIKESAGKTSIENLIATSFSDKELLLLKNVKRIIKANEISKFDSTELKSGSWIHNTDTSEYYFVEKIIPAGYLSYDEIKGRVLSDYQDYLERQWISLLRKEKTIEINNDALIELSQN